MLERFRYEPRRLVLGAALLVGLVVLAVVVAFIVRLTGSGRASAHTSPGHPRPTVSAPPSAAPSQSPTAYASDAASWDAMPGVAPAASTAFPAIPAADSDDPTAFAAAFASELFTRDYTTSTRAQLIGWAQYEDSPLQSPRYPKPDWTKVLVDSLTDLTWDQADATPIPADGPWLALQSESARETVTEVKVTLDPAWEQRINTGYQPPDPLATERDVTLTVAQRTAASGRTITTTYAVSIDLQLGTSARGSGYGVAATNNFVIKQVS